MNRKALRYWFEKEEIKYEETVDSFVLYTRGLSNDTLGEISACNGRLIIGDNLCKVVSCE